MRENFDRQLERLNVELITMGSLCEEAISEAVSALFEYRDEYVNGVFSADSEIDQKERDIEALCMKLLLKQQPVARDLRVISSALKMISDMERIGDQAADIAEITKFMKDSDTKTRVHIKDMADAVIKMVTESVDSFVKKDLELALSVIRYDDVVDDLFGRVKSELLSLLAAEPEDGELCLDLLMVAKYFERIGDHAVNIAEWVDYSITGIHRAEKAESGGNANDLSAGGRPEHP